MPNISELQSLFAAINLSNPKFRDERLIDCELSEVL